MRAMVFDVKTLDWLVCPVSGGALEHDSTANTLISRKAQLAYPIEQGIPVLIAAKATKLESTRSASPSTSTSSSSSGSGARGQKP